MREFHPEWGVLVVEGEKIMGETSRKFNFAGTLVRNAEEWTAPLDFRKVISGFIALSIIVRRMY
jgi:hypothetical protein